MFQIGGERADPDFNPGGAHAAAGRSIAELRGHGGAVPQAVRVPCADDYKTSFVDVVAGTGVKVMLDGQDVSSKFKELTGTTFFTGRLELGAGKDGVHVLEGSDPIGIQVIGYGDNTSYQYPGGLNLSAISAAPVK